MRMRENVLNLVYTIVDTVTNLTVTFALTREESWWALGCLFKTILH